MTETENTGRLAISKPSKPNFWHWSAPILIPWAMICLIGSYNTRIGFEYPNALALAGLLPIYIFLYIARVNYFLSREPLALKILGAALLLSASLPIIYTLSIVLSPILVQTTQIGPLFGSRLSPPAFYYLLFSFANMTIILSIYYIFLIIAENFITKMNNKKIHFVGMFRAAIAFSLLLVIELSWPALLFAPLLHLRFVWRKWPWDGQARYVFCTGRRAGVYAACVAILVYGIGIVRYLPDHGVSALTWPQTMRMEEADVVFRTTRADVLHRPQGRGVLPISGHSFLVPQTTTVWRTVGRWRNGRKEYQEIGGPIAYSRWVSGMAPPDPHAGPGLFGYEGAARFTIRGRTESTPNEVILSCLPERVFGLRLCMGEPYDNAWLAELGIDPTALQQIPVGDQDPAEIQGRRFIAVDDREDAAAHLLQAVGGNTTDPVLLFCDGSRTTLDDWRMPDPSNAWYSCRVAVRTEDIEIRLSFSFQMLKHWREMHDGLGRDLANWAAAAEGAERIDVVAHRIAEDWASRHPLQVLPFCQPDRILTAAIGIELRLSLGFKPAMFGHIRDSPICRPQVPQLPPVPLAP